MLYYNTTTYNLLFITFITLLLLADLGQFFLMGMHNIPLLFCLYCSLLCRTTDYTTLTVIALLQCLEFFCFYNNFSLPLLYLIPTTTVALYFKKYLYPSRAHIIALAFVGTIIQIYAIEGYLLHIQQHPAYTIARIAGILSITVCFSLIINIWGMQDNRA